MPQIIEASEEKRVRAVKVVNSSMWVAGRRLQGHFDGLRMQFGISLKLIFFGELSGGHNFGNYCVITSIHKSICDYQLRSFQFFLAKKLELAHVSKNS